MPHPARKIVADRMNRASSMAAVLLIGLAAVSHASDAFRPCITPEMHAATIALIEDPGFNTPIETGAGPISFDSISIQSTTITFTLSRIPDSQSDESTTLARVIVEPVAEAAPSTARSAGFAIETEFLSSDVDVAAAVKRAVASIVARDDGRYYRACEATPDEASNRRPDAHPSDNPPDAAEPASAQRSELPGAPLTIGLLLVAGFANLVSVRRPTAGADSRRER